jgi:cyclopropane-fatty-acyl-phospholipid synthase
MLGKAERRLLTWLQGRLACAPVRFVLWDGTTLGAGGHAVPEMVVKDRRALLGILWDPEVWFGEAYASGSVEVSGDLVAFLETCYRAWDDSPALARLRSHRCFGRRSGDVASTRHDIHRHYDLGNDFYRLWLDRELVYTCAYFPSPEVSLEDAQLAKMDHVCRKLRLRPGETVIEAGCGWGGLALHMARRYGVRVRAFNISAEQIGYARRRAAEEGLEGRVEFVEDDFRSIEGPADAFVSVGMLEHVGLESYEALGEVIDRCLHRERGRGLLHFIGRTRVRPLNAWIRRRVFPGAYPPTLEQVTERVLGARDLAVLDVENLRQHYALTLAHWLGRFEAAAGEVARMFDERFVRAWRLYLAGSQASFSTGYLQLFQMTFARGRANDIPWTREGLYAR